MLRSHVHDPRGPGADRRYGNIPDTATRDAVSDALEEARQVWSDWQDCETGPVSNRGTAQTDVDSGRA